MKLNISRVGVVAMTMASARAFVGSFPRYASKHRMNRFRSVLASVPVGGDGVGSVPRYAAKHRISRCHSVLASVPAGGGGGGGGGSSTGGTELASKASILAALQKRLRAAGASALVVPSDDPHLSEYVAACFERRAFVSGFTGSAGTAVVFAEEGREALLWTDGRYHLQAEKELPAGLWGLMKAGAPGVPDVPAYLAETIEAGGVVAVDPACYSAASCDDLSRVLAKQGVRLAFTTTLDAETAAAEEAREAGDEASGRGVSLSGAWVDEVWSDGRPSFPTAEVRVHPQKLAGLSVGEKLAELREAVAAAGADATVVASLDEVAWLLNLRGDDVECSPIFHAYVAVEVDSAAPAILFVDAGKVSSPLVLRHLASANVEVRPYDDAATHVAELGAAKGLRVLGDPKRLNAQLWSLVPAPLRVTPPAPPGSPLPGDTGPSPVCASKSVKHPAEMAGMEAAHVRDGAAMAKFFSWLFDTVVEKGNTVDEVDIDLEVTLCRKWASPHHFLGRSFPTIAGANGNGAIVHYRATRDDPDNFPCGVVDAQTMLLLDSGGQYVDGTTDVTRTVHLGSPTPCQKDVFTRVLKGNIALDLAVFPEGTPGFVLDVLARQFLWQAGLDYAHGTGHGVGAALNVHEGPMGVAPRFANHNPLKAGMVVSNEPGFYHAGHFGVRIENLLQIQPVDPPPLSRVSDSDSSDSSGAVPDASPRLGFKRLTLIPIQRQLIDEALLTPNEVAWLDAYHADVRAAVAPLLADEPGALAWLQEWTEPLLQSK